MEIMIEGKPAEDLKLHLSSLGIPGRQEHITPNKDFSLNVSVDRLSDEHANRANKDGTNGLHEELRSARNGGSQESRSTTNGTNQEALLSGRPGSELGPATGEKNLSGNYLGEVNNLPSSQTDKCTLEHKSDVILKQEENLHSDERETTHRQGNWVYAEILVLLEAKAKEYVFATNDARGMRLSADDKWKNVSDYCRSKGVQRTKEQCKVKWDNMMPDYRKVRDYEEQKEASAPSYFEMDVWERRMKLLPSNMDAEIYYRIASIQASKPTKGGIKREAREKRPFELTHILNQSPQSMGWLGNGNEGASPAEFRGQRPLLADLVGQHVASSSQKRRRRRRAVDLSFQLERKPESVNRIDLQMDPVVRPDLEIHDDSSTEDDAAVVNSRSQQGTPSVACVYADRSSFIPSHQQVNHESRLPVAYRSQNIPQQVASVIVERVNSSSATLEGAATKVACPKDTNSNTPDQSILNHVEDRKDARHRELIALEKEKLAVFREANIAIANAMTNAMSVFAKVAEELFLRHR